MIYVEKFKTRGEAVKRENFLKSIRGKDFKKLLRNINSGSLESFIWIGRGFACPARESRLPLFLLPYTTTA